MEVKTYQLMFGKQLTVRDLVSGFTEDTKTGSVTSMDGKLNIRPPYQREFVYEMDKNIEKAIICKLSDLCGYECENLYEVEDGKFELRIPNEEKDNKDFEEEELDYIMSEAFMDVMKRFGDETTWEPYSDVSIFVLERITVVRPDGNAMAAST